jgi:molecular chaperone DnaK
VVPLSRAKFEEITADLLHRTADTLELVLDQAKVTVDDLDAIVLVGGSTLMPQVPRIVKERTGREPYTGISPYTSVAQGAAIHAAILEAQHRPGGTELAGKVRKMLETIRQENVNSHGLGIVVKDPRSGTTINHVMIPRNSRLPIERKQVFSTNTDNQARVTVQVMEGDAPDPLACSLLGKCRITDLPPGLTKGSPVEVTYEFTTGGRIAVHAIDKTHGKEAKIDIERRGALTDEQVDVFAQLAADYKVE